MISYDFTCAMFFWIVDFATSLILSFLRRVVSTDAQCCVFFVNFASIFFKLGAGIGSVFGSLVIGYARNPSLKQQLFSYAILGFALSEAMGLFCLMMAFLILFAF